jgi:TolB-like protein/Flp pilus assembly protein TadD
VDDDIVSDFRREFQERGFQAAYRVTTGYFANHLDFPRVSPASIGFGYAFVGEREKAFAWLEKAYAQRDRGLSGLRTDPTIDSIRDDPRYHDLLRRMGLPPDERFKPAQPEPPADKIRLAVLPFENLGPADEEYFADGISDEIRSRLAAVRKLGVISRASAFQCKHIRDQRGRVGSELNVDYLIDGTIRWSRHKEDPDRVRITPELIRVSDEMVLWSKPYDGVLKDIFEVQSEIAEQVVTQLNVTLLPPERDAIEARPTDKLEAYDAYIRGLDYYSRPDYDKEDYELAIAMFNRAVSLDPSFALAYAQLSAAHSAMYHFQHDATEARAEQALAAANRARELEPSLAEAHLAHGCYQYCCRRDYDQALEALAVAQKGLPGDARILFVRAGIRRRQGRFEEALADFKSAFDLDPKNAKLAFEVGLTLASLRRHAQADCWYARAIALRPDQANAYMAKALNYLRWRGDIRAARDALESAPREGVEHVALARFYVAFLGRDWQTALDELAAAPSEGLTVEGLFLPKTLLAARVYQGRGEPDRAREAYDSARQLLEGRLREGLPDEGSIRSSLGIAFAGLGRTDDAIREGKRGVELCPGSRDVIHRYDRISNLAFIYVLVGEHDAALDQIEHLLSVPSNLSVPLLRLDPRWDPLSDHPRYKELLKRHVSEP